MYVQMDEGEKKNKATRRNEEEKKKKIAINVDEANVQVHIGIFIYYAASFSLFNFLHVLVRKLFIKPRKKTTGPHYLFSLLSA